nr:NAD(P)-dependent oxidoreductase [Halobaculum salinum]
MAVEGCPTPEQRRNRGSRAGATPVDVPRDGVRRRGPRLTEARFVALACPLNEATHHLFDAAAFEAMRGDAHLLNVARGAAVDEEALVEALDAGEISGAGLDVFEAEPLPEDSPLWDVDEVIVTPHRVGSDREYWRGVAAIVRGNVDRIREGGEMTNCVV